MNISVQTIEAQAFFKKSSSSKYHILLASKPVSYETDGINYVSESRSVIFLAPYQNFKVLNAIDSHL
ncbi:hypothetical protein [Albibacterium sp.]|uniref:hypothetical protein n=1 Tax=Albibacterium sp. TaxID=2952885 RepID=UPI002C990280|nr:hypothetical protein [Albibacterium sp.]HUH19667.1 hypothetical protein [Albibacterium sp.]